MSTSEIEQAGKHFSSEPVGWLFGRFGLIAILVFLVLAVWNSQVTIAVLLGLLLAAACLAKLWSRFSLVGVSCQRVLSHQRVFPDENIELKLQLVNRKALPLPWVQVDDEIPITFSQSPLAPGSRPGSGLLSRSTSLLWYTRANWRCQLQCRKRGYYQLGPLTMTSGDIFGLYPRSNIEPAVEHVIVYPQIFPIAQLGLPSLYPVGEARAERRIFEDPSRTIGVRDYNPYDSLKRIHWKASARHQKLQSKVYEPTTTLKVALFLAVDSFPRVGERSEENFELGISVAASLASHLIERDSPVGLFANTCQADSGQPVAISPGGSIDHLITMLESLAKVTILAADPFAQFLHTQRNSLPWGTTLVFILCRPLESLTAEFTGLRESGYKLLVIQIGDGKTDAVDGVVWHKVRRPLDLAGAGVKRADEA